MARHQPCLPEGIFQGQGFGINVAHQARGQGLTGGDAFAGQHHFAGEGFADAADQALGPARARHNAKRNFRQTETGILPGNHHIAQQRQLAARAQRVAIHGGNQRFAEGVDPRPQLRANVVQGGGQIFFGHLVEIGPGSKAAFVAGNYAHRNLAIGCRGFEGGRQLAQQGIVQGVARRRAVQGQVQHPPLTGDNQVAHAIPFASKSTTTSLVSGRAWQLRT